MLMVTVTKSQLSEFFLEFRALAFVPSYKEAIEKSYSKLNGPLTKNGRTSYQPIVPVKPTNNLPFVYAAVDTCSSGTLSSEGHEAVLPLRCRAISAHHSKVSTPDLEQGLGWT